MDFKIFGLMDLIIVLIFLISIFLGYKIGLLESALKWLKKLGGLIAGILLSPALGNFINKHFLNEGKIHDSVYGFVDGKIGNLLSNEASIDSVIDSLGFPGFIDNYIKSGIMNYDPTTIVENVTSRLTYALGVVIAFFILTIGVYLLYFLLLFIIKALKSSISIIDTLDKVLGAVIWGAMGCILIFIVLLVVTQVAKIDSLVEYREFIYKDMCINSSTWRLSKYINDHNFIRTLFSLITSC